MEQTLERASHLLEKLFIQHDIPESHGIVHAKTVMENCRKALEFDPNVPEPQQLLAMLAALLHDADDRKYWPSDSQNAETILNDVLIYKEDVYSVLRMIDYVSCSKNKNHIPDEAIEHPEVLYPRYADRLEALGKIGVFRCWHYAYEKGGALFTDTTPRPTTLEELYSVAEGRFEKYDGNYMSMMDHFYDKLLHIAQFPIENPYLVNEAYKRRQIIEEVCLHFGRTGELHPLIVEFQQTLTMPVS